MNYDERIDQCNADIQALEIEKAKLIKERENANTPKWEHGDTANSTGSLKEHARRLFIMGPAGLMIFDMTDGHRFCTRESAEEWAEMFRYVKTGNIFQKRN